MAMTASKIDRIIEFTKQWVIHYHIGDYNKGFVTKLKVIKLRRQHDLIEIETDCSIEYFKYEEAMQSHNHELNILNLTLNGSKLVFSNFIPYRTELYSIFKLLGQEKVVIIVPMHDKKAKPHNVSLSFLTKLQEGEHIKIENPETDFTERLNMFIDP